MIWQGNRTGASLPPPEQVFLAWLVSQSDTANLVEAAAMEIARLSLYRGEHPGPRQLQRMFGELVDELT